MTTKDTLFENLISTQYSKDFERIIKGCTNKVLSFRVNLLKSSPNEIFSKFSGMGIELNKTEWDENIFWCDNRHYDIIKNSEEYNSGKIYLQSLSSCIPVLLLSPAPNEDILDMAAAPGGKTTQIASMSNGKAHITACERNPIRTERLKYNLEKQSVKNVNIICKDARQLEDWFKFDKILLDAPCSGSGTLSFDFERNKQCFTEELIKKSVKTQSALISKAIKLLKKNGILIYSTCSILKEEDEDIIYKYIKSGELELIPIENSFLQHFPLLATSLSGTLKICPTAMYEGFFISVLRKR